MQQCPLLLPWTVQYRLEAFWLERSIRQRRARFLCLDYECLSITIRQTLKTDQVCTVAYLDFISGFLEIGQEGGQEVGWQFG